MLVLSRHTDEKIILALEDGRTIEIMTVAIRGDKIRLGITAPRTIGVHREEVWNDICQEDKASTVPSAQPAVA